MTPSDIPWGGLHCCMSQCLTSPILGSSLVSSVVLSSKPFPITHAESTPLATDSHHPYLMLRPRLKLTIHLQKCTVNFRSTPRKNLKTYLHSAGGSMCYPFMATAMKTWLQPNHDYTFVKCFHVEPRHSKTSSMLPLHFLWGENSCEISTFSETF